MFDVIRVGDLEIRPEHHVAILDGEVLTLSVRELQVLTALARRADSVVTREELYAEVWGAEKRMDDRSIDVYVHKLRDKLAVVAPHSDFIHTHFGLGYRLSHAFHKSATAR